jgi:hypothetical protein
VDTAGYAGILVAPSLSLGFEGKQFFNARFQLQVDRFAHAQQFIIA